MKNQCASSTIKTDHHDIAELLLKVALNTKNKSIQEGTTVIGVHNQLSSL
jgi:hypothetical protein